MKKLLFSIIIGCFCILSVFPVEANAASKIRYDQIINVSGSTLNTNGNYVTIWSYNAPDGTCIIDVVFSVMVDIGSGAYQGVYCQLYANGSLVSTRQVYNPVTISLSLNSVPNLKSLDLKVINPGNWSVYCEDAASNYVYKLYLVMPHSLCPGPLWTR